MITTDSPNDRHGVGPYFDLSSATTPAWLADNRLAFLWDVTGVPQVWTVEEGAGSPQQLTAFPERVGALAASPDGTRLVFGMDAGGNERQQLWMVEPGRGEPRALTANPEIIHAFGAFGPDGRRFVFASNARDPRWFDIMTIGLDDPTAAPTSTLAADALLAPLAVAPDGRGLLIRCSNSNLDHDLMFLADDGSEPRLITPHEGEATIPHAAFDPSGAGVYLLTNQDRDTVVLERLDLNTGRRDVLVEGSWDLEALAVAPDGKWLAYAVNEDGPSRIVLREVASGRERNVTGLPLGVVEGLTWHPAGDRLAFSFAGPRDPSAIWTCGLDGAAQRVTPVDFRALDPGTLVEPETIRYPTFDGREIPALWFTPASGTGPWPTVVDVHGGPESQRRPTFAPITQFLLARGYAVLAPNVRGSTGYGKTYCHLDDVDRRMDAVRDLAAASDWLRSRGEVLSDRIAVMGQSYGGFMTLAALTTYPDRWAVGVDVVGIANFVTFFEQTGPWRRSTRAAEYGDPVRDEALLRDISPIHRVDRIAAPLLVIHGRNDPRVPLGEAEQIASALRERGADVELLIFDDEGHGLVKRPNRIAGYDAVGDFLDRVLSEG